MVNREARHVELLRRITAEQDADAPLVQCRHDAHPVVNVLPGVVLIVLIALQAVANGLGPLRDQVAGQVAKLGQGRPRLERDGPAQRFPDDERRHDPGAGFLRPGDEILNPLFIDGLRLAAQMLRVAVDVVDGFLPHLQGVRHADRIGNVTRKGDVHLFRGTRHGVVDLHREARQDLQQVPPFLLLFLHARAGIFRGLHGVAREPGSGKIEGRTDQIAAVHRLPQLELSGRPLHPADGRHPVCHVHEQHIVCELFRLGGGRDVAVHLGKARHEVLALALDARGALGHLSRTCRPDCGDPVFADDDRLVRQHAVGVHREHADVHERQGRPLLRGRSLDGEQHAREHETGEHTPHHGFLLGVRARARRSLAKTRREPQSGTAPRRGPTR